MKVNLASLNLVNLQLLMNKNDQFINYTCLFMIIPSFQVDLQQFIDELIHIYMGVKLGAVHGSRNFQVEKVLTLPAESADGLCN